MLTLRLALRNVSRNPRRSLLTTLAIAVGLWSALGLAMLARGVSEQLISDAIYNLTGHIKVFPRGYREDPVIDYRMTLPQDLNQLPDTVERLAARVRVPAIIMSERESLGISLVGIDPDEEAGLSFIADAKFDGRFLNGVGDRGVVIGEKLAEQLQTGLGKRVVLMSQDPDNEIVDRGIRVVGIFRAELEATERTFVFMGRKTLQKMLRIEEEYSELSLLLAERDNIETEVKRLREMFPELEVQPWTVLEPLVVSVSKVQSGFLVLWAVIVVVAIGFGLVNTLFMAIFERTRELGLFQALGMKPKLIRRQVVLESFALILIGVLMGNALALGTKYLLADGINLAHFADGTAMMNLRSMIYPVLPLGDAIMANGIVLVLSLLSSFYPAYRASTLAPIEALSHA